MEAVKGPIPYTICFLWCGNEVLMLLRNRPPNRGLWNGLGGKISPGETPAECARREVFEEAGIGLKENELRFGGVVRWAPGVDPTGPSTGMYAFAAEVSADVPWGGDRVTPEGLLSWKPFPWATDPSNGAVVGNIPRFLPRLLGGAGPAEYNCEYEDGKLVGFFARQL